MQRGTFVVNYWARTKFENVCFCYQKCAILINLEFKKIIWIESTNNGVKSFMNLYSSCPFYNKALKHSLLNTHSPSSAHLTDPLQVITLVIRLLCKYCFSTKKSFRRLSLMWCRTNEKGLNYTFLHHSFYSLNIKSVHLSSHYRVKVRLWIDAPNTNCCCR